MSAAPPVVLYRDEHLLIIDKASGVPLFADRGGAEPLWPQLQALGPVRQVHRIDKGTSGVLAVALSRSCQQLLTRAFGAHEVGKFYIAGVAGRLTLRGSGRIDLPLRPGRKSRYRVAGARERIRRDGNRWVLPAAPVSASWPDAGHAAGCWCARSPAARIRSAYTWPGSAIHCSAIISMAGPTRTTSAGRGWPCMPTR